MGLQGDNMLTLLDITKTYGKKEVEQVQALRGLNINFRRNEFVSILGPSGCGKTTLLNIIGGLDRYTSGDLIIEGYSTKEFKESDWNNYRNKKIGFVFQTYNLIPHLTVVRNVELSLTIAGVGPAERRQRALEVLGKVDLLDKANKRPNQLSGGQMQRVAIARALINEPEIILADEPTGALDRESGIQVLDLLKEVASDRLVIMVTHNSELAKKYSTRIVNLSDGLLVEDTNPYSIEEAIEDSKKDSDGHSALEELLMLTQLEEMSNDDIKADTESTEIIEDSTIESSSITETKSHKAGDFVRRIIEAPKRAVKVLATKKKQKQEIANGTVLNENGEDKPVKKPVNTQKRQKAEKSSMSIPTAVGLSFRNLMSKKTRTFITAFASSIGIIGILLVFALSSGANAFISKSEENALSQYPIRVEKTSLNYEVVMKIMRDLDSSREDYPKEDVMYARQLLTAFLEKMQAGEIFSDNDLAEVKKYLDQNMDTLEEHGYVKYGLQTQMHIYSNYAKQKADEDGYTKLSPYLDSLEILAKNFPIIGTFLPTLKDKGTFGFAIPEWDEMIANEHLIKQQYELVGDNSKWPTKYDEVVIVLDKKNQVNDFSLFSLGLLHEEALTDAMDLERGLDTYSFAIDELLGMEYKIATGADYYYKNEEGKWDKRRPTDQTSEFIEETMVDENGNTVYKNVVPVKVVGVIRPRPGVEVTSINGVIGYRTELTKMLIDRVNNHPAMQAQLASDDPIYTYIDPKDPENKNKRNITTKAQVFSSLGRVNTEEPKSIRIYAKSFADKEAIQKILDEARIDGKPIKYSDELTLIMGFVETMATTITGVLIGFSAISLVVSSIMISIIIYTSVLERRKEIGVLRSLGARKIDISNVFNAESGMIGVLSGLIAALISFILSIGVSVALEKSFGIADLLSLQWHHVVIMVAVSALLSLIAGFIPSRIASKQDPAIVLRSE